MIFPGTLHPLRRNRLPSINQHYSFVLLRLAVMCAALQQQYSSNIWAMKQKGATFNILFDCWLTAVLLHSHVREQPPEGEGGGGGWCTESVIITEYHPKKI